MERIEEHLEVYPVSPPYSSEIVASMVGVGGSINNGVVGLLEIPWNISNNYLWGMEVVVSSVGEREEEDGMEDFVVVHSDDDGWLEWKLVSSMKILGQSWGDCWNQIGKGVMRHDTMRSSVGRITFVNGMVKNNQGNQLITIIIIIMEVRQFHFERIEYIIVIDWMALYTIGNEYNIYIK